MNQRNYPKVQAMQQAVSTTAGASATELRQEVINYASDPDNYSIEAIPQNLRPYIDKVVRHAYRITDNDVQALKDAGYTEEAIFELTVSAALGASLRRFHKALDSLED